MPVWLTLAAHFLIENDKLNLNKILGLIIALVGLFLAVYEPTTGMIHHNSMEMHIHYWQVYAGQQ